MPDYYGILGIESTATSGQIKLAYRRMALKYHPDKNPLNKLAESKFIEIAKAYEILSDPVKKSKYDNGLDPTHKEYREDYRTKRRPPPHYYYSRASEKTIYSKKVYAYATALVLAIVLIAVTFPIYIMLATSEKHFNLAVSYYLNGRYYSALHNIDLSIKDISSTKSEACALASVILVHRLHKYDNALRYIERGLDYNPSDSLASEFHYLKGICMVKNQDPHEALKEFNQVKQYSNTYDSSLFRSAIILTYTMTDLDSAEFLLNQLTNRNNKHYAAAYFKGIIYEKRADHENAYKIFSSLLDTPFNRAATLYHLAKSEIKLNLSDSACAHLKIASEYNLKEAKQLLNLYCKNESIFLSPYD
jgi:curved DNA-binding protein CbpA